MTKIESPLKYQAGFCSFAKNVHFVLIFCTFRFGDYISLEKEIRISLHSRDLHRKARVIYKNPDMFSELKRVLADWKREVIDKLLVIISAKSKKRFAEDDDSSLRKASLKKAATCSPALTQYHRRGRA